MRAVICLGLSAACIACQPAPLTREEAALALSTSVLTGVENLRFVTPRGCFTVSIDTPIDRVNPRRMLAVIGGHKDALPQEIDLELIDFELAEAPLASPTPIEGCRELWLAETSGAKLDAAARLKMVSWKTMLSDKGLAAGFQPGQTFEYRRQTLVDVDSVVTIESQTATVTYRWRWAPTEDGAHLGIRAGDPVRANATFTRSGGPWKPLLP